MNSKQLTKTLSSVNFYLLLAAALLTPIFFNPFSANLFVLSKTLMLGVITSVLIILWMVYNIITKSFRLTLSPFTFPLFLLTVITIGSSWGPIAQTIEGFINVTAAPTFLFFLFLIGTTFKNSHKVTDRITSAIIISGVLLAVSAIAETIGFGPTKWLSAIFPTLPQNSEVFLSPAGSAVILITYLIPTLIISLLYAFNKNDYIVKSLYFGASAFITAALVIAAFNILPGKPNAPVFVPFTTSWQVAVENIKSPKNFLVGVGAQHYVAAFSQNKTLEFNQNEFWNTRFNVARNYPLHLFTTVGIIGLGAWVMILISLFRLFKQMPQLSGSGRIVLLGLGAIVIINFIIPQNLVIQSLFIFLLIALSHDLKHKKLPGTYEFLVKLFAVKRVASSKYSPATDDTKQKTELLPVIIGVPMIILAVLNFYGIYRVGFADVLFRRSLEAASQNNGTDTYNFQRDAIAQNPFLSSYHRSYANTNLAIANSISTQGESMSDQDRQNITQLIQQAIREGRTAAIINPRDPANWETLAAIYRNLINVADGAVDWSTASYAEAIRLDPTNPRLRIEIGGIFYQLQDFGSAIRIFEQAVNLKPDWANAHYNLANAYRQADRLQEAAAQYDVVLALIDPTTADYTQALAELNAIRAQLGQDTEDQIQAQPGELTQPEPLPSPLPQEEQIDLGDEAAPPTPEETGQQNQGQGFDQITNPTPAPEGETPAETQQ